MNRALLAPSQHRHFEYRAFCGVSRNDFYLNSIQDNNKHAIGRLYFARNNHYHDNISAVRISIHSREKRASALDLTPEGDMNRALLAPSQHRHFECRAFCGVSRSDFYLNSIQDNNKHAIGRLYFARNNHYHDNISAVRI